MEDTSTAKPERLTGRRTFQLLDVEETPKDALSPYYILTYTVEDGPTEQVVGHEGEWYTYPDYAPIQEQIFHHVWLESKNMLGQPSLPSLVPNPRLDFFNRVCRKRRMEQRGMYTWRVDL